jgi:nucleoside 2-deoxyribosyltransferase
MSDSTIYLAGPVASEPDDADLWRCETVEQYSGAYDFENPLSKYNVPANDLTVVEGPTDSENPQQVGVAELVERDISMLERSDGVLVGYSDVQSIGTPMEVMWARERGYPVALWIRDGTAYSSLSPWYRYHATCVTNCRELALAHIDRYNGGGRDG